MKEAGKIRKTMPFPLANSSIYVCFAEKRVDLCRRVMSGPVDAPCPHGLFVELRADISSGTTSFYIHDMVSECCVLVEPLYIVSSLHFACLCFSK